jgi:cytohesin
MLFKELASGKYPSKSLVLLIVLLISLHVKSCSCNNSQKPNQGKSGNLSMDVAPTELRGNDRVTIAAFTLPSNNNVVDLTQYKLRIALTEIVGGTGTIIAYTDGTNKPRTITTCLEENVAHFFSVKELKSHEAPLKIPFTIAPGTDVNSIGVTFELFDKNNIRLKEYKVDWERKPAEAVHLEIGKLEHNQASGTVTYNIQNNGKEVVENIQLRYTNISQDVAGKTVELNSQQKGIINVGNIPAESLTSDQTLLIDFKLATEARFKFEILYQGNPVENGPIEKDFNDKAPLLKLTPLGSTKLVGEDKEIQFKIEKGAGSGNIDPSKLELLVTKTKGSSAEVYYNGEEVIKIVGTSLGKIGDPIQFIINSKEAVESSFALQLVYDGSNIGIVQTFDWKIDANEATEALFKAIDSMNNEAAIAALLAKGANVNAIDHVLWPGESPLHLAVIKGNKEIVETLVAKGANINAKNNNGDTPLHFALGGNKEVIEVLVAKGADVNAKNNDGVTPLYKAIVSRNQAVIEVLLAAEALSVNATDDIGNTPLHYAALVGSKIAIEKLVAKEANVNVKNNDGNTPLHLAAAIRGKGNKVAATAALIAKGADINATDKNGNTPLSIAMQEGNQAVIEMLLAAENINVNFKDGSGDTLLHSALKRGNEEAFKGLIAKGADVNGPDKDGKTPLLVAIEEDKQSFISILLQAGNINVDAKDSLGNTLLHSALKRGNEEAFKGLIAKGADVNGPDKDGKTPLLVAIKEDKQSFISILLQAGNINVDAKDSLGNTLLHSALKQGNEEAFKGLIAKGADVNARNLFGYTPLWLAILKKNEWAVSALLERENIDVNAINNNNERFTPLHLAISKENEVAISALLARQDVNIKAQDNQRCTPLHLAAEKGNLTVMEKLLAKGADINAKDEHGITPLYIAVRKENETVTRMLITKNADVNVKNVYLGDTPLHIAVQNEHPTIVRLLLDGSAKQDIQDSQGKTPLHIAVGCNNVEIVKLLLDNGAHRNIIDKEGKTPVDLAKESNNKKIRKLFGITKS